tara:strand:+ start:2563 stop:2913 length:351 start_codon:yes stop_codon:yes gene_type:complete
MALMAIVMASLGAHTLYPYLDENGEKLFNLAMSFQLWHALALLVLGLLHHIWPQLKSALHLSGAMFLLGIFLFCGNLYYTAIADYSPLHSLLPVGGMAFILGWLSLIYVSIKAPSS